MKRFLLILSVMVFAAATVVAQEKPYMVAFWNFENLFDIYDDPETHDDEFTPEGVKKWNEVKYKKKLANMAAQYRSPLPKPPVHHTIYHIRNCS